MSQGGATRHGSDDWDVFVSYERRHERHSVAIRDALRSAGLRVFHDLDALEPGARLDVTLEAALRSTRAGVLVGDAAWGRSGWATAEYDHLLRRSRQEGLPLIIVAVGDSPLSSLPRFLPVVRIPDAPAGSEEQARATADSLVTLLRRGWEAAEAGVPRAGASSDEESDPASDGRDGEAAERADARLASTQNAPARARLSALRAAIAPLLRVSRDRDALAALTEAWSLAERLDAPRADLAHDFALVYGRSGSEAAAAWLDCAADRAAVEGDEDLLGRVATQRALDEIRAGDAAAAVARLDPLVHRWTPGADPSASVGVLFLLGTALRLVGETRRARAVLEEVRFRARAGSDRTTESAATFELGTLDDADAPDRALDAYATSVTLSREAGDRIGEARGLAQAAATLHRVGRPEEARAHLAEARAVDPDSPYVEWATARLAL